MKPYTQVHHRYHDSVSNPKVVVTVGVGAAGCGKTYVACTAAVRLLTANKVSKVVVTRPAVCVDEEHGFLPGDIHGKMRPYVQPIYDCMLDSVSKAQLTKFIEQERLEIAPLAYMRGRTFAKALVIADEAQNMTIAQMKMLLTRVGVGSSIVITGDPSQSDLMGRKNGLSDLIDRVERMIETRSETATETSLLTAPEARWATQLQTASGDPLVDVVRFGASEMLRNDAITSLLELY